jgi:hypothetical protein
MVFRQWLLILAVFVLAGCRDNLKTKEKVQEAIFDRLKAHSGLDLNSLDVTTTDLSFENNKAYATVAFHVKGDPAVNGGMSMKYTLEERDGKWVVTGINSTHGRSMGATHGDTTHGGSPDGLGENTGSPLPAGHPEVPQ